MRWTCVPAALLLCLVGCATDQGGTPEDDACVSHYEPIVDAPTLRELKQELREDVDQQVRSLKVIEGHPVEGKVYVNLLDRQRRIVMSLDMWQRDDGSWTAQRWSQCID